MSDGVWDQSGGRGVSWGGTRRENAKGGRWFIL